MDIELEEAKSKKQEIASCINGNFIKLTNISTKTFKKCEFHYIEIYKNEVERIKENNKKEYEALKELDENFQNLHIHKTEMPNE